MEPTQRTFSIGYFILTFVVLLVVQALLFAPHSENLSYRDFKALLKAGKVEDLSIGERTITGRLKTDGLEGLLPPEKITALQPGKGEHRFVTVKVIERKSRVINPKEKQIVAKLLIEQEVIDRGTLAMLLEGTRPVA